MGSSDAEKKWIYVKFVDLNLVMNIMNIIIHYALCLQSYKPSAASLFEYLKSGKLINFYQFQQDLTEDTEKFVNYKSLLTTLLYTFWLKLEKWKIYFT